MPFLVRKISPETVFCFFAYLSSFRDSFPGMRMVRIFPFKETSALPIRAASTVRYRTSLTRMPVAQMASIPMLFLLNRLFGMYGLVWSQVTADVFSVLLSFYVFFKFKPSARKA